MKSKVVLLRELNEAVQKLTKYNNDYLIVITQLNNIRIIILELGKYYISELEELEEQ